MDEAMNEEFEAQFVIDEQGLKLDDVTAFALRSKPFTSIHITSRVKAKVERSHGLLERLIERKVPIYGVTTGFGDSCFRVVRPEQSAELQRNLIAYLSCGTGPSLSLEASRAAMLIRLQSFCRGFSGVSFELVERLKLFLEKDWIPVVPREGSLGASGDLIPLAYIAQVLQGQGMLHSPQGPQPASEVLAKAGVKPYVLKPKEGLALVNGTSAMAGLCLVNLKRAEYLMELAQTSTAWLCLALKGRIEAFGVLVNEQAKTHSGQARVAAAIRTALEAEDYRPRAGQDIGVHANRQTEEFIQDRYSLRCTPQVLGPIAETISQVRQWLETEINSTSDNPLIDEEGNLGMGGNFYGGYLGHGMDYLKICLAHIADLQDRQLMTLIDEKSNRGLPPNLADWGSIPEEERFLHHGLKGLHQAVNAITSEILAKAIPNTIFSRSSESHNQDKVSLGMSAGVQCGEMLETLFTTQAMYLICLAQALDLRGIQLREPKAKALYQLVRGIVPFVKRDMALEGAIRALAGRLKEASLA